jgi:hypothetical protein
VKTTIVLAALVIASTSHADTAVGIQLDPLSVPRGHVGLPLEAGIDGYHLAGALAVRYERSPGWAVNLGVGLPTTGMGLSAWLGHELYMPVASTSWVTLALYEDAGLQLGYAGPDYYARHTDTFVGFGYMTAGPLAFAARLPVGIRADFGRVDAYVEGTTILAFTPSVEPLFDVGVGFRVHF